MRPRKLKIAFIIWLLFFLLQRQGAMLLHQAYHFLVVEEEFRMRRRNQRRINLMLFRQMSQNAPRRRRAWGWPRPQNWLRSLLANPALNFLWKEHFRVTRWKLKASSKQADRNDVRVVQVLRVLICHRKIHLIDSQFPEIVLIVRKCAGKDGWKILESALRLFWKRCVATATK